MRRVRCVGIDPGSITGLCCLEVSTIDGAKNAAETLAHYLRTARVVGFSRISSSKRLNTSPPEQHLTLYRKLCEQLSEWQPDHIVLEEPRDGIMMGGGRRQMGTEFSLGRYFGLALAACDNTGSDVETIDTYQVTSTKHGEGWMPRRAGTGLKHTELKNQLIKRFREELRDLADSDDLSEHELMAYGVLCFHLSKGVV